MTNRIRGNKVLGLMLGLAGLALALLPEFAQSFQKDAQPAKDAKGRVGLAINDPKAFQGYTLISPIASTKTYLVDMQGRIVQTWEGATTPQLCATLLPNGHLLRPCGKGSIAGTGGRIQEFTFDGELVWDYQFAPGKFLPHHDIFKMPNGNLLVVALVQKTAEECSAAGRKGAVALESDVILEIKPRGKDGGDIVWEWHLWDHLIQDHDATKAKFGKVADHPELIDINVGGDLAGFFGQQKEPVKGKGQGAFGLFGGVPGGNWTHTNAVAYNAELDQVLLSIHGFSEIWIIDHGTTTAEAAGHKGGKQGQGGDLLYRWGNPRAYRAGEAADQQLFGQHNAHWIPKGLRGEGRVMVFNNGLNRPGGAYSTIDEIVLPVDEKGGYPRKAGTAFGPEKAAWRYAAPKKSDFFAMFISGAQRLPNGNTLICAGTSGTVFEVTPQEELVWKYVNPVKAGLGGLGGLKAGGFDLKKADGKDADAKKQAEQQKSALAGLFAIQTAQWMFRAYRYGPDYPGLVGRTLMPGKTIEESLKTTPPGGG